MNQLTSRITKYVKDGGERLLYCDVNGCPQTKETLKFVAYGKEDQCWNGKNYWILYECKFCGQRWFKAMSDKADQNPVWSRCISDEEAAKIEYERMYDL